MTRVFLIPLVFLFMAAPARAVQPSIPVHAWWSIPAEFTTAERYRELAEAGFTTSMSPFPNIAEVEKALNAAKGTGVKLFISCPELSKDPEGTVRRFMNHPSLAGYHLTDEPNSKEFQRLADWTKRIQAADAKHPCYINLFPTYANEQQLGNPTYKEHVDSFIGTVPVPFISYDHYPVTKDGLRADYYENLEIVSAAARAANKPFWAFALAVAHDPYPIPTEAELRLQVFSDLAYGAQTIQYFTYWTPKSATWNFHEAPIDTTGKRTPVYDRVRKVNREMRQYANIFMSGKVVDIGHTGASIPRGTKAFLPFAPFTGVTTGGKGAVVSRIENGGATYLVVVNRDYTNVMPLAIGFRKGAKIARIGANGGNLKIGKEKMTGSVPPGDMVVFRMGK